MKEIVLHLDEEVARTLLECLDGLGEHWAAGAPMPYPAREVHERLGCVEQQLRTQLGVPSIAEVMRSRQAELRKLAGVDPSETLALRPGEAVPARVPASVVMELKAIHSTGRVDMADLQRVVGLAVSMGLPSLARWIVLNQSMYAQGLSFGFIPEGADDQNVVKLWFPADA